jgi:hypothetical protein
MEKEIRNHLREYWDQQPDKWGLLEMDVRTLTDKIIERHKDNWGGDQYAIIDAIQQVFEGMFEKVPINEAVESFEGQTEKTTDSLNTLVGQQYYRSWGETGKGYAGEKMSKDLFFKVVKALVNNNSYSKIESTELDSYYISQILNPTLKLFGLGGNTLSYSVDGLAIRLFMAIKNPKNYEGIERGTITNADELYIPERKTFKVLMEQGEKEYINYTYTVTVEGYGRELVESLIYNDEDGEYNWYDWENSDEFYKEVTDGESGDKEVISVTEE